MSYFNENLEYNLKRDNETNNLEYLFKLQENFQKILGNNFPLNNNYKEIKYFTNVNLIKNQLLALFDETSEALKEVPWKPWKQNQQFNVKKFRMELIDVFHFLINLFLLSGMNSRQVINLFKNKNKINRKRQQDGY